MILNFLFETFRNSNDSKNFNKFEKILFEKIFRIIRISKIF